MSSPIVPQLFFSMHRSLTPSRPVVLLPISTYFMILATTWATPICTALPLHPKQSRRAVSYPRSAFTPTRDTQRVSQQYGCFPMYEFSALRVLCCILSLFCFIGAIVTAWSSDARYRRIIWCCQQEWKGRSSCGTSTANAVFFAPSLATKR